jgi:hypothetical protein
LEPIIHVCFGNYIRFPVSLNEIIEGPPSGVVISKYDKDRLFGKHGLFSNEIGQTPRSESSILCLFERSSGKFYWQQLWKISLYVPARVEMEGW